MAAKDYIPQPGTVEVTRSSLNSLKGDVARERRQVKAVSGQLTSERQLSERALEETLKARAERDEFRRILAASIRGEKIAEERRAQLEIKLAEMETTLNEFVAEAGRLSGRNSELALRVQAEAQGRSGEVDALKEDLRAERSRFERELGDAALERGRAEGRLGVLEQKLEVEHSPTAHFLRIRAVGYFTCTGLVYATALALVPPFFRALFGSPSPEEMVLATGMSGWGLFGTELLLMLLGAGLLSLGLRDYRASGPPPIGAR